MILIWHLEEQDSVKVLRTGRRDRKLVVSTEFSFIGQKVAQRYPVRGLVSGHPAYAQDAGLAEAKNLDWHPSHLT